MKKQQPKARKSNKQQQKPVRKRIGRLNTAEDVQKYISRCIKKAECGRGDEVNTYYKLVTMSAVLIKAIETATFEKRITRIEEAIAKQTEKQNEYKPGGTPFEGGDSPQHRPPDELE
jgi:hypothetical protein